MRKLLRKIIAFILFRFRLSGKLRNFLMWPVATRLLGAKYTEIIRLHNGSLFCADMSDIVGRQILFYGEYVPYAWEPQTTKFLELLARQSQNMIIAGAHIGYTVAAAARQLPLSGHIYCFEPVDYLFQLTSRNVALSAPRQVTVEKMALGEKEKRTDIFIDGVRSTLVVPKKIKNKCTESVMVTSIDQYAEKNSLSPIDVVFLDVEGYELAALKGCAAKILQQASRPDIIFEVVLNHAFSQEIYGFLRNRGYALYVIMDNYAAHQAQTKDQPIQLLPMDLFEADKHNGVYANVFATVRKGDYEKYVFIP